MSASLSASPAKVLRPLVVSKPCLLQQLTDIAKESGVIEPILRYRSRSLAFMLHGSIRTGGATNGERALDGMICLGGWGDLGFLTGPMTPGRLGDSFVCYKRQVMQLQCHLFLPFSSLGLRV